VLDPVGGKLERIGARALFMPERLGLSPRLLAPAMSREAWKRVSFGNMGGSVRMTPGYRNQLGPHKIG